MSNKAKSIVGKRSGVSSFKSASKYYDVFLGNCDPEIDSDFIKHYVFKETNINLEECSELKANRFSKSFKLKVLASKRDELLTPDIWPEGVTCRKYYSFNKRSSWYNSNTNTA